MEMTKVSWFFLFMWMGTVLLVATADIKERSSSSATVICTLPGDTEPSYVHAKATRVNGAETDVWLDDGTYEEITSPCQVIFDTNR